MHWSEIIMVVGIIIISTYVSILLIEHMRYSLSKISILKSDNLDELKHNAEAWKRYLEGKKIG